jgi:hypothetical protein
MLHGKQGKDISLPAPVPVSFKSICTKSGLIAIGKQGVEPGEKSSELDLKGKSHLPLRSSASIFLFSSCLCLTFDTFN